MKIFKWNKKYIDPLKLLDGVEAIHKNQAYPSQVFISPARYKEMKKYVLKTIKKECKHTVNERIDYYVGMHLLNFGPVELNGLPNNLVLVDDQSIKKEIDDSESNK